MEGEEEIQQRQKEVKLPGSGRGQKEPTMLGFRFRFFFLGIQSHHVTNFCLILCTEYYLVHLTLHYKKNLILDDT